MLNTFPQLLTYSFFAPTLLRITAAIVFAYLAYYHFRHKDSISHTNFPLVGAGMWIAWLAVLIEGIVALGLLLGYHAQINAIIGAAVALKAAVWGNKYPDFFVLSRGTSLLLLVICISLLLTGSGLYGFDVNL